MKPKMWVKKAFSVKSLAKKAFLANSLARDFKMIKMKPKMWPRLAQESFLAESLA